MLVFKKEKILMRDGQLDFDIKNLSGEIIRCSRDLPGAWQSGPEWCEVDEGNESTNEGFGLPDSSWVGLREVWHRRGDAAFMQAGGAWQVMNWLRNVRRCSSCGEPLTFNETDRGRRCPKCGKVFYAPLSPAVIVAVEREGRLLLAHNVNMPGGRYSVVAGFVEPGETLEQTVAREVREEVDIEVKDIRYFGSQPWPFPCSLMAGFTAQWKAGELRPDGMEIDTAGWFAPGDIPENIPDRASISRRLIDNFLSGHLSHSPAD